MHLKDLVVALERGDGLNMPITVEGNHADIVFLVTHKVPRDKLLKTAKTMIAKHGNIPVVDHLYLGDVLEVSAELIDKNEKLEEDQEAAHQRIGELEDDLKEPAHEPEPEYETEGEPTPEYATESEAVDETSVVEFPAEGQWPPKTESEKESAE